MSSTTIWTHVTRALRCTAGCVARGLMWSGLSWLGHPWNATDLIAADAALLGLFGGTPPPMSDPDAAEAVPTADPTAELTGGRVAAATRSVPPANSAPTAGRPLTGAEQAAWTALVGALRTQPLAAPSPTEEGE